MITSVTPAGPRFFCAPAKIMPNLLTSTTHDMISLDMSAISGTLPASGKKWYSVPSIVLLLHTYI